MDPLGLLPIHFGWLASILLAMRLTGDHLVLASWLLPSLSVPPAWPKFATNVRVSGRIPLEVDCQGFPYPICLESVLLQFVHAL